MINLNYEEIILLDSLIYLNLEAEKGERLLDIIDRSLINNEFTRFININKNCELEISEYKWKNILYSVKDNFNLNKLKIDDIESRENNINQICFIDDYGEVIVIYKGTSNLSEWDDNAKGAYEYDTEEQINALNYIGKLNHENITVSGHSKGGNKAQYVSILSEKVKKCISINGQGFSNEFLNKYKEEIDKNKYKIITINSKNDYVNCLFNSISYEDIYIETKYQINLLNYHKAEILLDDNGRLRSKTNESNLTKEISKFSTALISELPNNIRNLTIDGVMGAVEFFLCNGETNESFVKIAGGILILLAYGHYYSLRNDFSLAYEAIKALTVPLILWNDLIKVEEEKSELLIGKLVMEIGLLQSYISKKLLNMGDDGENIAGILNKSIDSLLYNIKNEFAVKI